MGIGKFYGHLPLRPACHIVDRGIRLHLVLEFGAQFERRHLQHLQSLAHLRRKGLLQFHGLRLADGRGKHGLTPQRPRAARRSPARR